MNISITRLLILLAFLPWTALSQSVENHTVGMDQTLYLEYVSPNIPLTVIQTPVNGSYVLTNLPYGNSPFGLYHLDYTPNPGYLGPDTIRITLQVDHPINVYPVEKTIAIEVVPANVTAIDDFFEMAPGDSITLDVLANDQGTSLPIVEIISLSNNLNVEIQGDSVVVAADPNYEGIAKFSYTCCVDSLTCDVALVSVFVQAAGTVIDTVHLGTNKEYPKRILMPLTNGYQVVNAPNHGDLENFGIGSFAYRPDPYFLGVDTFTVAYNTNANTNLRTIIVDVFNTPLPNYFANPDDAEIAIGDSASIDVLANDVGNNLSLQTIMLAPEHGTASINAGMIDYTANAGFEGVEHIRYKVCTPQWFCETTDLYIYVDNEVPAYAEYYLTTPTETPLVIDYPSDIDGWNFILNNTTTLQGGTLEYHDGDWTGQVNGQTVEGFNLIIYYPPANLVGEDEFSVQYCISGSCTTVDIFTDVTENPDPNVNQHCVAECVWPGDANADGSVDVNDVLAIGYCSGEIGVERNTPDLDQIWYGVYSNNWPMSIPGTNVNLKHLDTNGDGCIKDDDIDYVAQFHGRNNTISVQENAAPVNVPIYFVTQTPNPGPGDHVVIDILLGAEPTPAIDVSGISFRLNYNTDIVEPESFNVNFAKDSWLSYDCPVLDFAVESTHGIFDAAYTRVAGTMASGYGIIGTVDFIIVDDIDGIRQGENSTINIGLENPTGMNGNGTYQGLTGEGITLNINYNNDKPSNELDPDDLILYPNPSYHDLNVHINGRNNFRRIEVVDITGRMLMQKEEESNHLLLNISSLNEGIYFLRAVTDKGYLTQKFEVFKQY